ncbi:schwannomin-interacting protein 1 homolog isoform X2 [Anabrus simplex]
MRLKEVSTAVDVAPSRLHVHNVGARDRNQNQPADKLQESQVIHSSQWASNYVTTTTDTELHITNNTSNFNNNITESYQPSLNASSEFLSPSSPDDSLGDYEDVQQSSSSVESSPQGDEYRCFSHDSLTDSESLSDDGNCRGIVNPNYPGFQHLAHTLQHVSSDTDTEEEDSSPVSTNNNDDNNNNNNSDVDDSINHLDSVENFQKAFYDKPKFNIPLEPDSEKDLNIECSEELVAEMAAVTLTAGGADVVQQIAAAKLTDAFLSGAKEELAIADSNRAEEEREKFCKEEKEKDEDPVVPRKKEKMEINYNVKNQPSPVAGAVVRRREFGPRNREAALSNRRSVPAVRDKKRSSPEILGGFDVYNIETAMPKIDLDAIESHLRAAREEERRRRNDREEIRRRLAMGSDTDEYYGGERPGRKPSLQARLQSGMNLQICFMNETVSDAESPGSDSESSSSPSKSSPEKMAVPRSHTLPVKQAATLATTATTRPSTSLLTLPLRRESEPAQPTTEQDFFARQARLQAEARMALAQAKEMAHMQMEVERQRQKKSPITEMVRSSLEKVGIPFPEDRRRVSRQLLTEMNVAQLQVIVNDLHTQIEVLNEGLVKFLMDRDDLHMEQDSMLVDIEDLTRYLSAKEQTVKEQQDVHLLNQNNNLMTSSKPKINRIASLVKK